MFPDLSLIMRWVHIIGGFLGLITGSAAILLPKFSRTSGRHRWVGRVYAASMLTMGIISLPLSVADNSIFLLVIGIFTLAWVGVGWWAIRRAKAEKREKGGALPSGRLRMHIIWIGSSYIAAWTAFLVNVEPLGTGPIWSVIYAALPSVIGTFLIARAVARYTINKKRELNQRGLAG